MILVTGISGLTGKFLYQEIKSRFPNSVDICYFIRHTSDISWMDPGEKFVYGNLENVDDIVNALDGIDTIIHLAWIYCSDSITKACQIENVNRVIYINTTGMFSNYKAYAKLYIEFEEKIKKSGIVYTIIRPTMIYGNYTDVNIHKLVKLMNILPVFPVIGRGDGLLHPIYAQDLAKVIIGAYINEEKTRFKEYNVAGRHSLPYIRILQEIARALGKPPRFIHIPYKLALLAGKIGDIIPNGLINYEKVQRLAEDKDFDYSEAARDLGFDPIPFEQGIKLEVEDMRKNGII